jgi:hypothetical protein
MNLRTLLPLYRPQGKQKPLTATQMISLHLCQHRPRDGATSLDTNFGPHISVLPTEFEGHPFTWRVRADTLGGELVSKLPSHIKNRLDKMHETYAADFTACRKYLVCPLMALRWSGDAHSSKESQRACILGPRRLSLGLAQR